MTSFATAVMRTESLKTLDVVAFSCKLHKCRSQKQNMGMFGVEVNPPVWPIKSETLDPAITPFFVALSKSRQRKYLNLRDETLYFLQHIHLMCYSCLILHVFCH